MQTFDWSREELSRDSLLFNVFQTEILDSLISTGAGLDWTTGLYSRPDGEWRLPALDEYGDRIYSISAKDRTLNGDLHSRYSTPHGWTKALEGGQWANAGDHVRIKLTAFDTGRHLLEGWLTRQTIDNGEIVGYYALAHLGKNQDILGVDFTHQQLYELLADQTAALPRSAETEASLDEELRKLAVEFHQRESEILTRHGATPHPLGLAARAVRPAGRR